MRLFPLLFPAVLALLHSSCTPCSTTATVFEPLSQTREALRAQIRQEVGRPLRAAGKVATFGPWLFVVEPGTGFHMIDNSNPAAPQLRSFVHVPGVVDVAANQQYLYADSYTDLLVFDWSNPADLRLVSSVNDVFPDSLQILGFTATNPNGITVGFRRTQREVRHSCSDGSMLWADQSDMALSLTANQQALRSSAAGQTGSLARFALHPTHLYALGRSTVDAYSLANPAQPQRTASVPDADDAETLFATGNALFVGAQNGMRIYGVENPHLPAYRGHFVHFTACDPVVVNGNTAYVTLLSGGPCGNGQSRLNSVDVTDLSNPQLRSELSLSSPYGMSVEGNVLYVCDALDGLLALDVTEPHAPVLKRSYPDILARDALLLPGQVLLLTSPAGIQQFNASDPTNLQPLSLLPVLP